ncbi:GNAT family N-acetyltransferase [Nonomuraea spiralis]|uniref:GNAT family N-acetyltransferase n=1 Tax=Nonomuraea TaxID=83681 RepID=UPI00163C3C55|nr:GNAT family N-acetyltransferase [Nonomuraea sp. WAC 01424]
MTMIRALAGDDVPAVTAIYAHYVTGGVATFDETPPGDAEWRAKAAAVAAAGLPFLVAEADGVVAGYAYVSQYRPKPAYRHSLEDSIYLAPGHTGRGLGRLLLGELIRRTSATEARSLIAVIADGGDPASRRLHAAFGFEEAGRLRNVGFKHGRWIDTLLMQLDLR